MSANKLLAIVHFANQYHSGQWSRGYKLLCLAKKLLRKKGLTYECNYPSKSWESKNEIYKTLVKNHKDKI